MDKKTKDLTLKRLEENKKIFNTFNDYYDCGLLPGPEDIYLFICDKWVGGCPNCNRRVAYAMSKGYRKGYQKAEEVRKETAKEILSDLLDLHNTVQDINQKTDFYYSIEQLIAEIEIEYGVEVEE